MSEDHEAIRNLIYNYAFCVDKREYEKVGALLADATFSLVWEAENIDIKAEGKEGIEDFYRNHLKARRPSRHVITNVAIEIDEGGETASVYAYITSVGHPPEPPSVLLSGHYEDRFAKIDGEWRFTQKACIMELPA